MSGIVGLYVIYAVASYFRSYFIGLLSQRIIFGIRRSLYLHLQKMSLGYYERRKVGEVVSRMTQDISAAQNLVGSAMVTTLMDFVFIGVTLSFLFAMNVKLALLSLWVLPCFALAHFHISGKIRLRSRRAQEQSEYIQGELHEQFSSIATTQAFGKESVEAEQFKNQSRNFFSSLLSSLRWQSLALAVTSFLTAVGPVVVLWVGAMFVMSGAFTTGKLIAFYSYLGFLYQPIQRMTELGVVAASSLSAIDRIYEAFDSKPDVVEDPSPIILSHEFKKLNFQQVRFGYQAENLVLDDFTLEIKAGESVAFIGPSGAGKSTIFKLLLRFYDPQSGGIYFDGVDIRQAGITSLRKQSALVAQDSILLNASIRDNLTYAKPEATDEEIQSVIQISHSEEFVKRLPKGLDTMVGEMGALLSGGQRQRLAIARALLKDAPIILMDEPTSALDPVSEDHIRVALQSLFGNRTALIIAHRLSTIESVDRIVVIESGRVVEQGNPKELRLDPNSRYEKLVQRQIHSASDRLKRT